MRILLAFGKLILILSMVYGLLYLETLISKKKYLNKDYPEVEVEVGDIIYRSNSYSLLNSSFYGYSGYPGHLAIALSHETISPDDLNMGGLIVGEARYHDRRTDLYPGKVSIQKACENFGDYKGRRLVLKMHLTDEQKKKVIEFVKLHQDKPYRVFHSMHSESYFNCATFVRSAIIYATGKDLDSNRGQVLPTDIVRNKKFKPEENRINF